MKAKGRKLVLRYYEQMVFCWNEELTADEKRDLESWESVNLRKGMGTADWPGWKKHIGNPPFQRRRA